MRKWSWLLCSIGIGLLGCATSGDLDKLRQEHLALQATVDTMRTKQTRLLLQIRSFDQKLESLSGIFNQFRKRGQYNFANIGAKLDELRTRHQELLGNFQLLKLSFDKLNQQITQPGANGGGNPGQTLTPEATFQLAQKLFASRKFDQAIGHLKTLVNQHAAHSLTDDAYMLIGDCYSEKGNAFEAIIWYNDVRKKFPTGDQVDHALLKLGLAHFKIGACPEGKAFLRRMLRKYRSSNHASKARELLSNWRSLCVKR